MMDAKMKEKLDAMSIEERDEWVKKSLGSKIKEIEKQASTPILDVCCGGKMFYFDKKTRQSHSWIFENSKRLCATVENSK